jgi:hypothetical protein
MLNSKWIFLANALVLATAAFLPAQSMPKPELLLTDKALMLVKIKNCKECISQSKKAWYDVVYKDALAEGKLRRLDTPASQLVARHQKATHNGKHLIGVLLESIAQRDKKISKQFLAFAEQLKIGDENLNDSDIVEAIAECFSGEGFVGIEDDEPYFKVIFGFEYDADVFDWLQEFELVSDRQCQSMGIEKKATTIDGIRVIHLPLENWFVFAIDGVLYGVEELHAEYTHKLIARIQLLKSAGGANGFNVLSENRRYQRCAQLVDRKSVDGDIFIFADLEELVTRKSNHNAAFYREEFEERAPTHVTDAPKWNSGIGISLRFDSAEKKTTYVVAYPLISPLDERVSTLDASLGNVRIPHQTDFIEQAEQYVFLNPANVKSHFASSSQTTPTTHAYVNSWRKENVRSAIDAELFSVLTLAASNKSTDKAISQVRLSIKQSEESKFHWSGPETVNALYIPNGVFDSHEDMLDHLNREIRANQFDATRLSKNVFKPSSTVVPDNVRGGRIGPGKRPTKKSRKQKTGQEESIPKEFCLLESKQVNGFDVYVIGLQKPSMTLIQLEKGILVLPDVTTSDGRFNSDDVLVQVTSSHQRSIDLSNCLKVEILDGEEVKLLTVEETPINTYTGGFCAYEFKNFLGFHQARSLLCMASYFSTAEGSEYGRNFYNKDLSFIFRLAQIPLSLFSTSDRLHETKTRSSIHCQAMILSDKSIIYSGVIKLKE